MVVPRLLLYSEFFTKNIRRRKQKVEFFHPKLAIELVMRRSELLIIIEKKSSLFFFFVAKTIRSLIFFLAKNIRERKQKVGIFSPKMEQLKKFRSVCTGC